MLKLSLLSLWGLAVAALLLLWPRPAEAGGVVGFGTPGTCTPSALHNRLAGGGLVTFDCGGAPVTIVVSPTEIITLNTTIQGGNVITLSGGSATAIFDIESGSVTLRDLTLSDGFSKAGGAIYNNGRLTVVNTHFSNNRAIALGGAIYSFQALTITQGDFYSNTALFGGAVYADGDAVIRDTSFTFNRAATGGAIENRGRLTLSGDLFLANTADSAFSGALLLPSFATPGAGGALDNVGTTTIVDSDFGINIGSLGGAVYNTAGATLSVQDTRFAANTAPGATGGAIFNRGALVVNESTFSGNRADGGGTGGGLVQDTTGSTLVANSTFTGNVALVGGGLVATGTVTISNTTFSANFAFGGGGLLVAASAPTVTVLNSTFAGNGALGGSAIDNSGAAAILLKNTILAGTPNLNCFGPINSLGHNIDDGNTCGLGATGDLTNTDPLLGPLAGNGGPTQTQALLPGSPAINHGDNNGCPARDQRGYARIAGCDIGAFEVSFRTLLALLRK